MNIINSKNNMVDIDFQTVDYFRVEKVIEYLKRNLTYQPGLEEIAKYIGINKFDLQKTFKRWAGISPKQFLQYLTLEYAKGVLKDSKVDGATYEIGLSSSSRLHDLFVSLEGVTPSEYKKLGKGVQIDYGFHQTKFGKVLIGLTKRGICFLNFVKTNEEDALGALKATWPNSDLFLNQTATKELIDKIFYKKGEGFKLFVKGTNFQIQVWKALLKISEGNLMTYKDIANHIQHENALRAVGTAIGRNPIAYLIPCHRVINSSGKIGNYSGGKYRKEALIAWEAINRN